jgi:hypothetical protein
LNTFFKYHFLAILAALVHFNFVQFRCKVSEHKPLTAATCSVAESFVYFRSYEERLYN